MKKLLSVVALLLLLVGCSRPKPLTRTELLLDTVVTLTLYDGDEEDLDAAFALISRLHSLLSPYEQGSDIYRLREQAGGEPVDISQATWELLVYGQQLYTLTEGRLDVTVGPLVALWDISGGGHLPTEQELSAAKENLGMADLWVDPLSYRAALQRPGMGVDVGALAKGYIADRVKELLTSRGVTSGIIDLGHNILLIGEKPGHTPFSIGIQNPEGGLLRVLELQNQSLVTSGTYQRFFEQDGTVYHHVLDPFTGYPADTGVRAVTVLSPGSLQGDALSTVCLLLGEEKGMALIERLPDAEALFLLTDGRVLCSSGFPVA